MLTYILLYFAVGLPVLLALAFLTGRDEIGKRIVAAFVLWLVWPLVPIAMIREHLALKRINLKCAWCGEEVTPLTNPVNREAWAAHHRQCPNHPLRPEIERLATERDKMQARWEVCIDLIREWPTDGIRRPQAMKLYGEWCDWVDEPKKETP